MIATTGVQRAPPRVEYNGSGETVVGHPAVTNMAMENHHVLIKVKTSTNGQFSIATCELTRGYPVLTHS